jgi:outer membrane protein assembly factor BamB
VGQLLALKPGNPGEVVDANQAAPREKKLQVVWKIKRNVPRKPSLVLKEDRLFMIDDSGIASCVEALTGKEVWRERIGGDYSASPIYGDGHIYFFSEDGKATVIEASDKFKIEAQNKLDSGFMASPAVAGKALFLRTRTHLYRIENFQ